MLSRVIYRKISRYTNSYIGAESISLSYRRRLGLQKVTSIGFATKSNITRNYGKISASYFRRAIKRIYKIITKALSLGKRRRLSKSNRIARISFGWRSDTWAKLE